MMNWITWPNSPLQFAAKSMWHDAKNMQNVSHHCNLFFPEMEAEGHEPTMRQVAQTWLGPKSYHTSQRPSLQVVWESLAVSLKSTIFHTGGLHCHGKITSIKMGFARLPVVVVWRLVDMTCLCNQPECSCASEDNHSNLRGCKATLHMW